MEPAELAVAGRPISVTFRRNAKARRLILRLSRDRAGVVVTLPPRIGRAEALDFVKKSAKWIAERLSREPVMKPIVAGGQILIRGESLGIMSAGTRRGAITIANGSIIVTGDPVHLQRRLVDWLKAQARHDLVQASEFYAQAMEVKFIRLSVRDQKSRWGSCSSDGTLSYSWRLILAPPFVLDYVAAHEVAHLRHMNHGRGFWRLVLAHCPNASRAKAWLKQHGAELHSYASA
ncbi:M48 family metallopeptidase [Taklimakanibacter lacteus]|uniref:M48 family metallopeptidase n=1 Tax=Taklimakanibacter lacteus TaxID=2268456 RepID=UPI000E66A15B